MAFKLGSVASAIVGDMPIVNNVPILESGRAHLAEGLDMLSSSVHETASTMMDVLQRRPVLQGGVSVFGGGLDILDNDILGELSVLKRTFTTPMLEHMHQVTSTVTEILVGKLALPAHVAELLLAPILSMTQLVAYEGVLTAGVTDILAERHLLDSLAMMQEADLGLLMEHLAQIRSRFSSITGVLDAAPLAGDRPVLFPILARKTEFVVQFKEEVLGMIFEGLDNKVSFLTKVIPDSLLQLFSFYDVELSLRKSLSETLQLPNIAHSDVVRILANIPLTWGAGGIVEGVDESIVLNNVNNFLGKNKDIGSKFLSKGINAKDAFLSDLEGWKVGTFSPLAELSHKLIDLVKGHAKFLVDLTTAVPEFAIESLVSFVLMADGVTKDVLQVKMGVLELMATMPFNVLQSMFSAVTMAPIWSIIDYDSLELVPADLLAKAPFSIEQFPGGFVAMKQVLSEMRKFKHAYDGYSLALGYDDSVFPFGVFAEIMKDLMNASGAHVGAMGDGSMSMGKYAGKMPHMGGKHAGIFGGRMPEVDDTNVEPTEYPSHYSTEYITCDDGVCSTEEGLTD